MAKNDKRAAGDDRQVSYRTSMEPILDLYTESGSGRDCPLHARSYEHPGLPLSTRFLKREDVKRDSNVTINVRVKERVAGLQNADRQRIIVDITF